MKKTNLLSLICALAVVGVSLSSCDFDASFSSETVHQHTYSSEWSYDDVYHWHEADCEHKDQGYIDDLEEHIFGDEPLYIEREPGCGTPGLEYKECLICGYVKAIETEPTGLHTFGAYQSNEDCHWLECLYCDYVLPSDHSFVLDEAKSFSENCGKDGLEVYTCSICSYTKEVVLPATGNHSYGEYQIDNQQHYQECSVCGDKVYGEHMMVLNSSLSLDPTCGASGYYTYSCFYCGYSTTTVKPATEEHIAGDYLDFNETGHFNYCSVCGDRVNFEEHNLEYHYLGTGSEGVHYQLCSVCGYQTEEVPHDLKSETILDATCSYDGEIRYYCNDCDYEYTEAIPATGEHEYEIVYTTEPTCTSSGSGQYVCIHCGATGGSVSVRELGHDYESGVYSYSEDGHYQICKRCGEQSETISHTISETITMEPGCESTGLKDINCTVCDYTKKDVDVPATGHTYDLTDATYTAPTCTTDGSITATCTVCGKDAYNEVIPATGHTYDGYIINGDYHYQVCTVCGSQTTPVGHNASEEMTIDVDCHNIVCEDCGATLENKYHTFGEDDICTECGYELAFKYTLNSDETITINGLKNYDSEATFPSYINGYPVTSIGNSSNVISDATYLTEITIPSTVTQIEDRAFYNLTYLTKVNLCDGLTTIGNYAFYRNSSLEDIILPESLETIGRDVFYECTSLTEMTIPSNVSSIGMCCFYGCSSLVSISIKTNKLTEISSQCFYYCQVLSSINIPDGVTTLGSGAFEDCYELHEVVIPKSVTYIYCSAFGLMRKTTKSYGIQTIYYMGTPGDKSSMTIESKDEYGNSYSVYTNTAYNCTWYYYDEDGTIYDTDTSNTYWHYVEGEPTLW